MPFFQFDKINYRVMIGCLLLAVSLVAGCVAQKTENVGMLEKENLNSGKTMEAPQDLGEKIVQAVDTIKTDHGVEVKIQGNQKLEYTSIKQAFPFGIAVYLSGTRIPPGLTPGLIDDDHVGDVRVSYADEKQKIAKIEILLKKDLPYEVREDKSDLNVVFFKNVAQLKFSDQAVEQIGSEKQAIQAKSSPISEQLKTTGGVIPDTPAVLTGIKFDTTSAGKTDIRVETSHPVKYDVVWQSDKILNMNLYNTHIPKPHQRPLLTQYFNSAVESILPRQFSAESKNSQIQINIREQVPYRIVQDQNMISMFFDPSSIDPPVFTKARKDLGNKKIANPQSHMAQVTTEGAVSKSGDFNKADSLENPVSEGKPRYTGEKIKLDFFETDIKNVFRILKSVSGLNFAIDKDVQGKVTMALEDPVAWDQVLDLVLKMNGLGKKHEGNVIRIATVETLQREEEIIQEAFAAKKKSQEQKENFEPLVTEYIPINYSDAMADIKPHIEQILSKDRGKISVDQRTNMVIITDTMAKIDQAREIIYRLDTVTPQIMIEAKVVEVTKEFSRKIGVGWNLSNAASVTSGFVDDYNISINSPSGSGGNMDLSFFKLFGSSVTALNAKLAASEEQGEVKIVSSPRILTLDNKKARIKQGLEYAYLERDDAGGSSVKFKDIDLLLEVTPHVTPDKRISMTLLLTKNDIAGLTQDGVPTLATNEAETELLVNNNDTVVIGGIVKTTKNQDNKGLPFLTGIPVLGYLFGTDLKEDDRNELLIFLTPSIVQLEQKRNIKTPAN